MSGRSVAKILLGLSLGLLTACAVFAAGMAVGAGVPALGTLISRDASPLWPWNPDPAASDPAQSGQDDWQLDDEALDVLRRLADGSTSSSWISPSTTRS